MFLRIATTFFRQPLLKNQLRYTLLMQTPMLSILTNHKLLIQNLSYLQSQFYQMEECNDELELLKKFQQAECSETTLKHPQIQ
ncbi:unnamed protein product [Paramecium pentaurelia]|uniref:Uncharacterized protein n=1 Tax=Paramecium pentaurelia TaxID=43138 RepID=A0A8S1Y0P8_9CILI|nr:unnamed protein product [Paramecium pentaurelia]